MGSTTSKQQYDHEMYRNPINGVTLEEKIIVMNGRKINVARWCPTSPKAVVLVSHGLHEHALRYFGVAASLAAKNYIVIALDHSSHGLSDGIRGYIPDYKALPLDFVTLANLVRDEFPQLPFFVLAHSMGTLVATLAVKELAFVEAVVFSGCPIFSGPASSSPFGLQCLYPISQSSAATTLTRIMAAIAPKGAAAPILINEITSDLKQIEILKKDPRRYEGDIMNRTAYEVLRMIAAVKTEIPSFETPFLCIHGHNDKVALPKSSQYFVDFAGTDKTKKSLQYLPDLKHEIFFEKKPYGPAAIKCMVDYFESQFSPKAYEQI